MTTESRTRVDPGSPGETARAEEAFVTRWSRRKQAARSAGEVIIPKPNVAEGRTAPVPVLTDKDNLKGTLEMGGMGTATFTGRRER